MMLNNNLENKYTCNSEFCLILYKRMVGQQAYTVMDSIRIANQATLLFPRSQTPLTAVHDIIFLSHGRLLFNVNLADSGSKFLIKKYFHWED